MQQGMSVNRTTTLRPVDASGSFAIGDLPVDRLGFGAMRLTGVYEGHVHDLLNDLAASR